MSKRLRWAPSMLPRIRGRMIAAYQASARRTATHDVAPPGGRDGLIDAVQKLRSTSLWWVTDDMAQVAMDAAADLPAWVPASVRPAASGLLVWDGGLAPWSGWRDGQWEAVDVDRVDGVTWWTDPPTGGIRIGVLARTTRIPDSSLAGSWRDVELMSLADLLVPAHEPTDTFDLPAHADGLLAVLGATWALMMQETLVSQIPLAAPTGAQAVAGAGTPTEDVLLVDLRRRHVDVDARPSPEPTNREYHHRWTVRGHWRQQPHGPQRSLRRPTWIPPHVKGPDDAPLVPSTRVHVWRR